MKNYQTTILNNANVHCKSTLDEQLKSRQISLGNVYFLPEIEVYYLSKMTDILLENVCFLKYEQIKVVFGALNEGT